MTPTSPDAAAHPSYATYVKVWAALILLTAVTVGAAYADLKHLAVLLAVLVAGGKSSLVLLYFMHLRDEHRLVAWMFLAVFATFVVFLVLTFADYAFR